MPAPEQEEVVEVAEEEVVREPDPAFEDQLLEGGEDQLELQAQLAEELGLIGQQNLSLFKRNQYEEIIAGGRPDKSPDEMLRLLAGPPCEYRKRHGWQKGPGSKPKLPKPAEVGHGRTRLVLDTRCLQLLMEIGSTSSTQPQEKKPGEDDNDN